MPVPFPFYIFSLFELTSQMRVKGKKIYPRVNVTCPVDFARTKDPVLMRIPSATLPRWLQARGIHERVRE